MPTTLYSDLFIVVLQRMLWRGLQIATCLVEGGFRPFCQKSDPEFGPPAWYKRGAVLRALDQSLMACLTYLCRLSRPKPGRREGTEFISHSLTDRRYLAHKVVFSKVGGQGQVIASHVLCVRMVSDSFGWL